jgi:ceramide glucosyltransferase
MMEKTILILLYIYSLVLFIRHILTYIYYRKEVKNIDELETCNKLSLKDLTIFQPILSGDRYLQEKLTYIYNNSQDTEVIWAIDEDDHEAERIVNEIIGKNPKENLIIMKCKKSSFHENPKVYKIIQSQNLWRKYTVILDDDTSIDIESLKNISVEILDKSVITGIPYYLKAGNLWENLLKSYVNSNSIYNYLTAAFFKKNNTINGMFYIFKSEKIKSLDLYNQIKGKLCDDYEFAKIVRKYNISIQQSIFPCKLNTEIKDFKTFIKIMRRWHIFVNHYLKDNISIEIIVFSLIPFVSGSLFLLFSIIYNHNYIYLLLIIFTFNSLLGKIIRRKIFGEYENILDMILEIFSNIVQIFYWFLSLIQPDRITWRGKLVKIKNGTIEVNIDEQKNKG